MKKLILFLLIIGIASFLLLHNTQAQEPPTVNIPPTNAYAHVKGINGTANATYFDDTLNLKGLRGIQVLVGKSGTVYFNATLTNGTGGSGSGDTDTPITCQVSYRIDKVSVSGNVTTFRCVPTGTYNQTLANNVIINSGGYKINFINGTSNPVRVVNSNGGQEVNVTISSTSGGITTAANIGTGGFGFFKNATSTTINLRNLTTTRSDLFSLSQSANNVNLDSTFKAPNKNCGAGSFLQIWTNTTGFTCAADNAGTITTAANIGHGGKGLFQNISGTTINLRNITSANSALTITQNSTDLVLTNNALTSAITSLNFTTNNDFDFRMLPKNMSYLQLVGQIFQFNLKPNILLGNGTTQNVTKIINFNNQARITGLMENFTSIITSNYTSSKTDDLLLVNTTNANITISIPTISVMGIGKILTIKKMDYSRNFVEIIPIGSTIDPNFKNMNLTNPMDSVTLENNATIWFRINTPTYAIPDYPLKSQTNSWYGSWINQGNPTTFPTVNNTIYAIPLVITRTISLSQIESEVTSFGVDSECRMAIYNDNGRGYPQDKIKNSDFGILSTTSNIVITNTFASKINLLPGNYYLAEDCNAGTTHSTDTITKDTTATANSAAPSTNATLTVPITVANNNNRILICGIAFLHNFNSPNNNNNVISTVKIGSALSFTKIQNATFNNSTTGVSFDSELWYLLNPPTGTLHVTITPANIGTGYDSIAGVDSIYNVNSSSPIGVSANVKDIALSSSISLTPTNTSTWLFENVMEYAWKADGTALTNPSDTSDWNIQLALHSINSGSQHKINPTVNAVSTMTWSFNPKTNRAQYADTAFELKPHITLISGTLPTLRAIPASSLGSFFGMPSTMGSGNAGTMYSGTFTMGSPPNAPLPDTFPSGASISTGSVPEILVNVVG